MDNNKIKNKIKDDPAFTLEVQNPEVEELMTQYASDKKAETLNKLIDKFLPVSRQTVNFIPLIFQIL